MGLVYLKTFKHSEELVTYIHSIQTDISYYEDYLMFEVDARQRIQLKTTLPSLQSDLGITLIAVEGFENPLIMKLALELTQEYSQGRFVHLYDLLLASVLNNDFRLFEALNDVFSVLKPELIETARMYLWADGNAKLAASALYLHRNTFNYRMHKFEEKSSIQLTQQVQANFFQLWLNLQNN